MIKRGDQNKIVFFGLIMMGILCDAGTNHILVGQENGFRLACCAGGEVETTGIIVVDVNI
jgi:hypothetical protein